MANFGPKTAGRTPLKCPELAQHGIELYLDPRENGQLCMQIRQAEPMRWRLKSLSIGRQGRGDIVWERDPEAAGGGS
jgi:hypothetical protein